MDDEVGGPESDDKKETLLKPSEIKSSGRLPYMDKNESRENSDSKINRSKSTDADDNSQHSEEDISSKHPEGKLCGWLTIIARGIIKTIRQRWFVYGDRTCKLYYYRNQNDVVQQGEIDISRATFNFDPANADKPGLFQIRSDNREHVLDALNRHAMMYWLQELQKRRRVYNSAQSNKFKKPAKRPQTLSGIDAVKFHKQTSPTEGDLSPTKVTIPDIVVPVYTPLEVSTGIIGGGKMSKPSPSPSSSTTSTASEDWTVLDASEQGKNNVRNQNVIMNAFNKMKGGRKASNASSTTDVQACHRCKQLQSQLTMSKEEHQSAEDELQAHREIIRLLQKELDNMSRNVKSRSEASSKDIEGLQTMIAERDKHITELQYSIVNLKEEKAVLVQKDRSNDGESDELKEQVTMYQEMLKAKDDTIMQLTNEITALEKEVNNNLTGTHNNEADSPTQSPRQRQTVIVMTDTQELARLKDMCQAYELQNKFLTKEILELNYLRQNDQANEKALLMSNANLEAQYFKTRSKYLYLLEEMKKPKNAAEETKPDEVVDQLLNEAMAADSEELDNMEYHMTSSGREYDRYGFVKRYGQDEEEIDPLSVKAEQMERYSDEVAANLKDKDENDSIKLKWENFMVGLGVRPLTRSSELKALVRMGVPQNHREQIWKGCVNFHVGETRDKLGPSYYKELSQRTKGASLSPESKQIELDLLRTLPNNRHFESIESTCIDHLRKILLAYSLHNPVIGYCQGLNRIAAITLLFLPEEEEAFWCLVAIVDFIMPKDYYSKSLMAAQVDQRVLKDLLHEKLPRVYSHFEQLGIDISLFTFNWFLTIFIDNIPTSTFLRIWDTFLYEGSKVLFRFAVAFFKHVEEDILKTDSALQLNHFMRVLGEKMNNPKQISQLAFNWINPFPMRFINTSRRTHLHDVKHELERLDMMRSELRDKQDGCGNHGNSSDEDQ